MAMNKNGMIHSSQMIQDNISISKNGPKTECVKSLILNLLLDDLKRIADRQKSNSLIVES
jgi:hypothetical protein